MGIEFVTKGVCFDNLIVEVTVVRYTCDDCARRECFHDTPKPYNEIVPDPRSKGWRIITPIDDGTEGARCAACAKAKEEREAQRAGTK
jgi:hypothetical protein